MPKRVRDFVFPFLMITLGAQVLFNSSFSLLGIMYAFENNMLAEFLLVVAGYSILGVILVYMLRFTTSRDVYLDTLKATLLTVPLMGVMVLIGIQFYQSPKFIPILIGAVISAIIGGLYFIKKANWVYWLALVYVDILAVIIILFDIQI